MSVIFSGLTEVKLIPEVALVQLIHERWKAFQVNGNHEKYSVQALIIGGFNN